MVVSFYPYPKLWGRASQFFEELLPHAFVQAFQVFFPISPKRSPTKVGKTGWTSENQTWRELVKREVGWYLFAPPFSLVSLCLLMSIMRTLSVLFAIITWSYPKNHVSSPVIPPQLHFLKRENNPCGPALIENMCSKTEPLRSIVGKRPNTVGISFPTLWCDQDTQFTQIDSAIAQGFDVDSKAIETLSQ